MSPGYPAVHVPLAPPSFGPAGTNRHLIPLTVLPGIAPVAGFWLPHLELRMLFRYFLLRP